ncbi:MAG TPA: response regulator transcription factor [Vicinamibacterales bacterium]|nr:response regulator transcription factor [Vicinamibacterales bacterium]
MTRPALILLVDDERAIQRAIAPLLRSRGYGVAVAATGREAIELFERDRPDLVVLDLGLPDMDGTEVCRQVRERADTPILVLSARGAERDKVAALDHGADDYITKPFGPEELMARVRAALRRSFGREMPLRGQLMRGELTIDFDRRRVSRGDVEVRLTPREFELLTLLVSHAGRVLTHRAILKSIWGTRGTDQPENLRVLIGQLRKKIEPDPAHPRYLLTEPWVGYRFADDMDQ